ncbi:hypothetical protein C5167_027920 [Papaver somniferum]|nr:hypothetical protein C5167_027920 [Papaver somniferum]
MFHHHLLPPLHHHHLLHGAKRINERLMLIHSWVYQKRRNPIETKVQLLLEKGCCCKAYHSL